MFKLNGSGQNHLAKAQFWVPYLIFSKCRLKHSGKKSEVYRIVYLDRGRRRIVPAAAFIDFDVTMATNF